MRKHNAYSTISRAEREGMIEVHFGVSGDQHVSSYRSGNALSTHLIAQSTMGTEGQNWVN